MRHGMPAWTIIATAVDGSSTAEGTVKSQSASTISRWHQAITRRSPERSARRRYHAEPRPVPKKTMAETMWTAFRKR